MLADGRLHLSGIARLAGHLTRDRAAAVLERACGMSHREIRELVAELEPKPDVALSVRKLAERRSIGNPSGVAAAVNQPAGFGSMPLGAPRVESGAVKLEPGPSRPQDDCRAQHPTVAAAEPARPPSLEPLAPSRYLVRFTASAALRDKLERLKAPMRSAVPDGDLGRIIDIAVSEKLLRVEAKRFGRATAPRRQGRVPHVPNAPRNPTNTPQSLPSDEGTSSSAARSSRYIPAAVKRLVHARDGGRCAFRDNQGLRCDKRHDLEFHHRHPFGRGGDHSPANLSLMCKTHNTLLAEHDYGEDSMARVRATRSGAGAPVDTGGAQLVVQPRRLNSG